MKILIVEDQERLGNFLERGLRECAYTVTWVRTCKDARDALADSAYDVIVLDLACPTATASTCCGSGAAAASTSRC